jgi:hypothetical protein
MVHSRRRHQLANRLPPTFLTKRLNVLLTKNSLLYRGAVNITGIARRSLKSLDEMTGDKDEFGNFEGAIKQIARTRSGRSVL